MRLGILTAGIFLTTALAIPALADGCGDALYCHPAKPIAARPVIHHAVRPHRVAANYYDYAAAGVVGEGYGHGAWRVAPNDGQVPMGPMIQAMPGPCCAAAPLPQPNPCPCYAPMAYGPPPMMYGPQPDAYANVDDKGWTGGVGYNAQGGGGGGGGFMDGFGQVHFAQGGGTQNGPTYNDYNQSFQSNPSVPGAFVPQKMGVAAPVTTSK